MTGYQLAIMVTRLQKKSISGVRLAYSGFWLLLTLFLIHMCWFLANLADLAILLLKHKFVMEKQIKNGHL